MAKSVLLFVMLLAFATQQVFANNSTAAANTTAAATTTAAGGANTTAGGATTTAGGANTTAAPATTTAAGGTTAAPTTTPTVSSAATKVNAEVKLNANFADVNKDAATKAKFEAEMTTSIAGSLGMPESQIQNMQALQGSIILKFTIVAAASGTAGAVSPAAAVATLKAQVSSGSLKVNSTVVSSITVDKTYFVAAEPVGYACFSCNSTAACKVAQVSTAASANCALSQTCWLQTSPYVMRYCGPTCTTQYLDKEYCVTTGTERKCSKCCTSAKCNKDVASGANSLAVGAPLLLAFGLLLQSLLSASL